MERVEYADETDILTQAEVGGEHWYIIESGEVRIMKNDVEICRFSSGEDFGEMELMYACRTAASVVACGPVVCWRLDRKTYRHVVMRASQERRALCKEALRNVPFLESMTAWQQDHLADALSPCGFVAGDIVLERDSLPEHIHIITEGTAKVMGDNDEEICKLSFGELIGELEFLNQHKAVACVVAETDLATLQLSKEHFELCLGPVKTFLQENALSEKYKYYRVCSSPLLHRSPPPLLPRDAVPHGYHTAG